MDKQKKIEILEYLRFISMTEVFLIHYMNDYIHSYNGLNIPMVSGKLGVAFFFMITAYLLVKTADIEKRGFLKKKAMQLLPKYEIILILIFVISLLAPSLFKTFDVSIINFIKSIFLIPYRTEGVPFSCPLLPVAWTLGVQAIVFILFWGLNKITLDIKKTAMMLSVLLIVMWIIGSITKYNNIVTFTYCRFYMLYFSIGFFVALLEEQMNKRVSDNKIQRKYYVSSPVCIIGLGMFLGISCIYEESIVWLFMIGVLFTAAILLGRNLMFPKYMIFLGKISYSFFLLHYLVCKVFTRMLSMTVNPVLLSGLIVLCYLITVVISFLYDWVVDGLYTRLMKG